MTAKDEEKTLCRTPTPDRKPTRIPSWKYEAVAQAIRAALEEAGEQGVLFAELRGKAVAHFGKGVAGRIGSIGWHVTTVKLEMEVRGELVRKKTSRGQRLFLAC